MFRRILGITLVIAASTLLVVGATGIDLPGNPTTNPGEQRFNLEAKVTVSAEDTSGIDFTEGKPGLSNLRTCTEKAGLVNLNIAGGQTMGITTIEDVEVQWTLQGPIDTAVRKTDNLGSISQFSSGKTTDFKATNLPPGEYVLHVNAYSNGGSSYTKETITVTENTAVSNCGSGVFN